MAAVAAVPLEPSLDLDKLTYEIFSILEEKFLFPSDPHLFHAGKSPSPASGIPKHGNTAAGAVTGGGKVRILSIDAGGSTDGILAAKSLSLLESSLRKISGDPDARIADFFDVVAGAGAGGILAALLLTRSKSGRPLFTADGALRFLAENRSPAKPGLLRRIFRPGGSRSERIYRKTFSEYTLKDTLKPVLIPCYDVLTGAPFLFSRADALETDGYDFKMKEVCRATSVAGAAVEMRSLDGRTKIVAVDGGVAMSNPTAAAITHVLNNKQEFPFCRGVEDLIVVSLGNGESDSGLYGRRSMTPGREQFVRIAGEGVSDMVDQAVSMAFGDLRSSNYIRIQANSFNAMRSPGASKSLDSGEMRRILSMADEMLMQRNVESILFRGKKIVEKTNMDKLEWAAKELIKEDRRRRSSGLPTVMIKQGATPRTSSSTLSPC
ncbi:patatin-like protein 6 [Magnolia sinica]|uniref:patatin-like protein 6 n=1 Tax=Magnolia sinica TaxID=86752 RepID=UPI00265B5E3B|nr:patatin-like protein 6 [Magnolia sinica]